MFLVILVIGYGH